MTTKNSDPKKSPFSFLNEWQEISSDFRLNMLEKAKLSPKQVGIFENLMNQMGADVHSTFRNTFSQQVEIKESSLVQEDIDEAEELSGDILGDQDNHFGGLLKTIRPHPDLATDRIPVDDEHREKKTTVNIDPDSLKNPGIISEKDKGISRRLGLPNVGNGLQNPMKR